MGLGVHLAMLFDYYGELLSESKKEIFILYYVEDYSLSEIAEHMDISRQAVSNSLNKACKAILDYESILHLLQKENEKKAMIIEIKDMIDCIDIKNDDKNNILELIEKLT